MENEKLIVSKLKRDKLKFSNINFKSAIIEDDIENVRNSTLTDLQKLNFLKRPPYPDDRILVTFSSRVYKEVYDGRALADKPLPDGWKLLTTAYNDSYTNQYFGAAYWNPQHQQIVIAHRGTVPTRIGAIRADISGILNNEYVPQMSSAVTFANTIKMLLDDLNEQDNINIQLSFTGHSLGGWLAQISTFTTEFFELNPSCPEFFSKNTGKKTKQSKIHAHTVVFDSPGCLNILKKIKNDLSGYSRYLGDELLIDSLDIKCYLTVPNLVNTCRKHISRTVYRVSIKKVPKRKLLDFGRYTRDCHAISVIEEAFSSKETIFKRVKDWPLVECYLLERLFQTLMNTSLFKWACRPCFFLVYLLGLEECLSHLNEYDQYHEELNKEQGESQVHYQFVDIERGECNINVFADNERQFLIKYKELTDATPGYAALFEQSLPSGGKYMSLLKACDIIQEKRSVLCKSDKEMLKLLATIQNLLRFFPCVKDALMKARSQSIWFNIPQRAIEKPFIVRKEDINCLHSTLVEKGVVVVSGLPGVGKSELVTKYAREYGTNVILINGHTADATLKSFQKFSKMLNIKTIDVDGMVMNLELMAHNIYSFLRGMDVIFIFDNVEDHNWLLKLLPSPSTPSFRVIITTRNDQLLRDHQLRGIPLQNLDEDTAGNLVKSMLSIGDNLQDDEVKRLVQFVGCLPLAILQAVAYIKERGYNNRIRKCLDLFNTSRGEFRNALDGRSITSMGYDETTLGVIITTLHKVKNINNDGGLVEKVLNIIAFLDPDKILTETFLQVACKCIEDIGDVNQDNKAFQAKGLLNVTLKLLASYYIIIIIEVNRDQVKCFTAQRLVQQVIRLELEEKMEVQVLEETLQLLQGYLLKRDSAEEHMPSIISVWNEANRHSELVNKFIVTKEIDRSSYTSYFHSVIRGCNYEIVEKIVNEIGDSRIKYLVNAKDGERRTVLHYAAWSGDDRKVRLLLKKGANVNVRQKHEWTPLHLAAKEGHIECVKVLVDNGAKVDARTGYKFTSLHLAARSGHSNIAKLLLDNMADINSNDRYKFTPLHFAVKECHVDVVRVLISYDNINVNAETEFKVTPLHFAAQLGYIDAVEALLSKNADINAENNDKFTALHKAVVFGHFNVVEKLLQTGKLNVNAQTSQGNTSLHLAAEKDLAKMIEILIAYGADENITNNNGDKYK